MRPETPSRPKARLRNDRSLPPATKPNGVASSVRMLAIPELNTSASTTVSAQSMPSVDLQIRPPAATTNASSEAAILADTPCGKSGIWTSTHSVPSAVAPCAERSAVRSSASIAWCEESVKMLGTARCSVLAVDLSASGLYEIDEIAASGDPAHAGEVGHRLGCQALTRVS